MKTIYLILLLISLNSSAQLKLDSLSETIKVSSLISDYYTSSNLLVNNNLKFAEANKFMIFNKDISEIMVIKPDGTVYYTPKFFCKCKKCLNFKGKKKLKLNQKF